MRPYHVAIVGSGPSGYFAAASLLKFADTTDDADVRVDMLEMLPTPWGLVRSGVAPDHPKIKTISAQFEKTAADPRFRYPRPSKPEIVVVADISGSVAAFAS